MFVVVVRQQQLRTNWMYVELVCVHVFDGARRNVDRTCPFVSFIQWPVSVSVSRWWCKEVDSWTRGEESFVIDKPRKVLARAFPSSYF